MVSTRWTQLHVLIGENLQFPSPSKVSLRISQDTHDLAPLQLRDHDLHHGHVQHQAPWANRDVAHHDRPNCLNLLRYIPVT